MFMSIAAFSSARYGHAGKVGPEFAPALEGSGRTRHIADWNLYDRHYGPLFDGSAFAGTPRRSPYRSSSAGQS
jgi:hypothetical protein